MCGIAGAWGNCAASAIGPMTGALGHRGPDDSGITTVAGVALGHRRLAIIETSALGHQPMTYGNGRWRLVFNGEIYNFRELRGELERLGHAFVSHSDSEVLLAAFAQWGEEAVSRLRGMFAFAIHDTQREELFLARDRFGIKPLYYCETPRGFLFSSELKSLMASGEVQRRADAAAFWHYLTLGSIPQPATALRGVHMLPAGHFMRVREGKPVPATRYWHLGMAEARRPANAREAAAQLRELLEEAARLHLVSDVPVGAFLSGGIDSSAVVGLMARAGARSIRTFSVGFDGPQGVADEREWARLAARHFGTDHTEVVVSGQDVAAQFDRIVEASDQPSLDGTNTFLVSQAASRDLKVAVSGLGADELFAGYPHFRRLHRAARLERLRRVARHVPRRFLQDRDFIVASPAERYASLRSLAAEGEKEQFTSRTGPATAQLYAPLLGTPLESVAQTTLVETSRYLADTLLRDCDAMSMAWSLEVRPMFLDHRLAEFAYRVPQDFQLGTVNKPLLVEAVRDLLPPALLSRTKTGFELPLQGWLAGPLRERALEAFSSAGASQWFSPELLAATTSSLARAERPPLRTWAYLMWLEWARAFGISP